MCRARRPQLPPWLAYFVATAQRSEYLIDWLIFHETLSPPRNLPWLHDDDVVVRVVVSLHQHLMGVTRTRIVGAPAGR